MNYNAKVLTDLKRKLRGPHKGQIMFRVRQQFEDTAAVMATFSAQTRRALMAQGAYIRAAARNSMKSGKPGRPSAPGTPPHALTRLLKDFLFFSWDSSTSSVVVGPAGIRNSNTPRVLEEGGTSDPTYIRRGTSYVKGTVVVRARPYMAPAMQRSQAKLSEFWSKSVRAA